MPLVEILDGPPEWAGTVYETDEDMVAKEIGLIHPRWRGTPVGIGWSALYAYRKVEVVGERHRYRYQGPPGAGYGRLHPAAAGRPDGRGEPVGGRALAAARRQAGSGQGCRAGADRGRAVADDSGGQGGPGAPAAPTRRGAVLDQRPAVSGPDDLHPDDRGGPGQDP